MKNRSGTVSFLYASVSGRLLLKLIMGLRLDRIAVAFLRSPLSKPVIAPFARRNNIPLTAEQLASFRSYRDFFVRGGGCTDFDREPEHLISPCDGWLSAFPIDEDSCFSIKSSHYRVTDFLQDRELASKYTGGCCLVFRLCVSNYHHYCYIDDGWQGKNHFIPGMLHSVQPIACETCPVFVLNRRSWCLMETEHFGSVVQCEIGALVVGGIVNEKENARFTRGEEKGRFELSGSTIVLLFEPGQIVLNGEILKKLSLTDEVQVKQGEWIGCSKPALQ